jgi:hypothetical protein
VILPAAYAADLLLTIIFVLLSDFSGIKCLSNIHHFKHRIKEIVVGCVQFWLVHKESAVAF